VYYKNRWGEIMNFGVTKQYSQEEVGSLRSASNAYNRIINHISNTEYFKEA